MNTLSSHPIEAPLCLVLIMLYAIGLGREEGGCGGRGRSGGPGAVVEGRGCNESGVLYWECQGCVALAISTLHFRGAAIWS